MPNFCFSNLTWKCPLADVTQFIQLHTGIYTNTIRLAAYTRYDWLQIFQKSSYNILYIFFHDLIHVYSTGEGADNPLGTKFWCHQENLVTSDTFWKLKKIPLKSPFWRPSCSCEQDYLSKLRIMYWMNDQEPIQSNSTFCSRHFEFANIISYHDPSKKAVWWP